MRRFLREIWHNDIKLDRKRGWQVFGQTAPRYAEASKPIFYTQK